MSEPSSILPLIPKDQLKIHCEAFERYARDYWEKSHDMGLLKEHIFWYQQHAAIMYAQARRVRAEAINRR